VRARHGHPCSTSSQVDARIPAERPRLEFARQTRSPHRYRLASSQRPYPRPGAPLVGRSAPPSRWNQCLSPSTSRRGDLDPTKETVGSSFAPVVRLRDVRPAKADVVKLFAAVLEGLRDRLPRQSAPVDALREDLEASSDDVKASRDDREESSQDVNE
jgi:hypothetical protein